MATVETGETTAGGSGEPPAPEGAAGEQLYESPDRKHVDALLDISEEELLKELEPPDQRCSTGWDEAVRGWARAAPLSCILTQNCKNPKLKESADPPLPDEGSAANNTPDQFSQQAGRRRRASSTAPLRSEASASPPPAIGAVQKSPVNLSEAPVKTRLAKIQRPSHPSNTLVPIRHFTFLPPIVYPHLRRPIPGSGATAPEGPAAEDPSLSLDKKSRTRGRAGARQAEAPAGRRQNNPGWFSVISVSAHNRLLKAPPATAGEPAPRPSEERRPGRIPARLCVL